MSHIPSKTYCFLLFVFVLGGAFECGVFRGVHCAEQDLQAYSTFVKHAKGGEPSYESPKRKRSVGDHEIKARNRRAVPNDENNNGDSSDSRANSESNGEINYESAKELSQAPKAQVKSNDSSSQPPTNSSIISAPNTSAGGTFMPHSANATTQLNWSVTFTASATTEKSTQSLASANITTKSQSTPSTPMTSVTARQTTPTAPTASVVHSSFQPTEARSTGFSDTERPTTRFVNTTGATETTPTENTADNGVDEEDPLPRESKKKTLFGFVTIEILIAVLAGAACAVILVAFLVYRIKKRNEGSYELSETMTLKGTTYSGKDSEKEVFV